MADLKWQPSDPTPCPDCELAEAIANPEKVFQHLVAGLMDRGNNREEAGRKALLLMFGTLPELDAEGQAILNKLQK